MIQVKRELEGSDIDEAAAEAVVPPVLNYYQQRSDAEQISSAAGIGGIGDADVIWHNLLRRG